MDKCALSVHLAIDGDVANAQAILRKATVLLREQYKIYETTIQIEIYSQAMLGCIKCEPPA